jgi:EmrB/QacA subfamily drug resistance transporter
MSTSRTAKSPTAPIDPKLRRLAFVVLSGAIMTILDTTIVVVAIKTLGSEFHTSLPTIQWVLTAYMLALSMTIPITRWTVERFGAKTMWITSLVLFTIGSILCGIAWSVGALIVFRIVQGIGGGLIMPVGQTMLARAAGPERMGRIMVVIAVPAMLAPVLGPALGGLIVDNLSWRWMFFINLPICLFAVAFAAMSLDRDTDRQPATRLDIAGLLLLSPGLAALVYGLSEAGRHNVRLAVGAVIGVVLITAFVLRARRQPSGQGLLELALFRLRTFSASTAGLFLYVAAVSGLTIVLPLYYQVVRGSSPLVAGAMIAPIGLGAMFTMPIAGKLTDKKEARGVALTGIIVILVGTALYTQIQSDTSMFLLAVALFVVGLGHGLVFPSLQAAGYRELDKPAVPAATTMANIATRVATSFGTAALAVILQIYIINSFPGTSGSLSSFGGLDDPGQRELLTRAFGNSLWWTFGIAAAALIPTLILPRQKARIEPATAAASSAS